MATQTIVKADKEAGDKVVKLSDMVKFTAAKPKDFPKDKKFYLKDGKTYPLHRLHAERLEKKGFGKIEK